MRVLLVVLALLGSNAFAAEQPRPAFLQPEVLEAAAAINLNAEQQPLFREALGRFVDGRTKSFNSLMRRNNQTNLPRKLKGRTNSLLKKMDKEMAEFLSEEQMPAYKVYRDKLKANLRGM